MLNNFLQDWLINKLNGYFIILYSNNHYRLAKMMENLNDMLVLFLIILHFIPPRRRLA
jgi:hypothetical protein